MSRDGIWERDHWQEGLGTGVGLAGKPENFRCYSGGVRNGCNSSAGWTGNIYAAVAVGSGALCMHMVQRWASSRPQVDHVTVTRAPELLIICTVLWSHAMATHLQDEQDIDLGRLERELVSAIEADRKYSRENDAKFRAIHQKVGTYEEFR